MHEYEHLLKPRSAKVMQNASFSRRALAFVLDILLIDLVLLLPFTPLFTAMLGRIEQGGLLALQLTRAEMGLAVVVFLLAYCYFVIFEYVLSQTPGMMVVGIKVKTDSLWQPLVRNTFIFPIFPFVILWLVEPLLLLWRRRTLLEQLSHTQTIHPREVVF